ncbi:hypothetical protein TVAG_408430 [Trichomonas vaginalis G3]|uniref:Uncharacterized protein n=1 Tax=Trichomonas vaginalis (strain ATCC PRA-98 / G3) TaxID=412133 RepID=A2F6P4_TRIV3|nr:hypothetical protein TVAGG3_0487440 [Trichomonas vaginalis G3]EAX99433.1 hypothetical protein TVAG_408430 [Trichomonas vaginalis G3]KAI5516132.1 hypothetical protein TVAGG3_0487440 [Trichomonas vaginalis G3]|eukprot:XP_001312363.1 hypothetical protein [Trichomonas vaginalis G3]
MTLEGEEFPQSVFFENLCFEGETFSGWEPSSGSPSIEYYYQIYVTENFIKEPHNEVYNYPYGCATEKISLMRPNVFEAANGNYPKTFKLSSDIYQNKNADVIATGYIYEFLNVPNAQRILKAIFRFLNLNNGLEITLFALVMILSAIIAILTALLTRL